MQCVICTEGHLNSIQRCACWSKYYTANGGVAVFGMGIGRAYLLPAPRETISGARQIYHGLARLDLASFY